MQKFFKSYQKFGEKLSFEETKILSEKMAECEIAENRIIKILEEIESSFAEYVDSYETADASTEEISMAITVLDFDSLIRTIWSLETEIKTVRETEKKARDKFINHNIRLVIYIARNLRIRYSITVPIEELVQEGMFGLFRAVDKYDPKKGYKFSTYAIWWIRQIILRFVSSYSQIKVPRDGTWRYHKILDKYKELYEEEDEMPTLDVAAAEMNTSEELIERCISIINSMSLTYVDDSRKLDDTIDYFDEKIVATIYVRQQNKIIKSVLFEFLSERVAKMIIMYYMLDNGPEVTFREIGKIFNLSRERVRQLIDGGIRSLQKTPRAREVLKELR